MKPTFSSADSGAWTRAAIIAAAVILGVLSWPAPAGAQLDPLIALKRVPPRIVIVFDTSFSMLYSMRQYDPATGLGAVYCDPAIYSRTADNAVASAFGVHAPASQYRRRFLDLAPAATGGYTARGIMVTTDQDSAFATPCQSTRYEIARAGITAALRKSGNPRLQWGLVKLRQNTPAWRIANAAGCENASIPWATFGDSSPCDGGGPGNFAVNPPTVAGANTAAPYAAPLVLSNANTANTLANNYFDASLVPLPATAAQASANRLVPAGRDTNAAEDRPLALALADARSEVVRAMGADTLAASRNTIVVLVTAGRDYSADPATKAAEFLSVSGGGATRRVPIYVVGVSPKTSADEEQLADIATASGGLYIRATDRYQVERAVNLAIQAGCQRPAEIDAGRASEFPLVSPVIGTVNLDDARSATGSELTNSVISTPSGSRIPQRNNIMVTASFVLGPASLSPHGSTREPSNDWNPGFEGRLRAYRVYKPVADSSKPSGYVFTKDGTPLWPDLDGRPETAGVARTPADPNQRNIFTCLPGGQMVEFSRSNLTALAGALNAENPGSVIDLVRKLPLGAIISSTPAIMDPPSLDPPPDDEYGRTDAADTYAGAHANRRSIIWVGANDGMLHAIDARTGYEVWAFIPYNLLPKLQALVSGQSPYEYTYFVDQSPKIAEVKVGGAWKSVLIIGEGWGGTFYQAFDITEAGMGGPAPDSDDHSGVLASFASASRVPFLWSFPDYAHFDPTMGGGAVYVRAADTTSFGRVKFFGDLADTADTAERKMGFSWSDPAVGALNATRTVNAAIVGSGYFPAEAETSTSLLTARRNAGVGRTFYLLDVETGRPIGNASGSACSGTGCLDVGDAGGTTPKNALHADPTVTSDYGSYVAKKAYMGDLDGNYWRFTFTSTGAIAKTLLKSTGQPIYASSALMWVGTTQQYIFFSTGSDMLPTSPGSTYGTGTFALYALKESSGAVSDAFSPKPLTQVTSATPENPVVNDSNNRPIGVAVGERPSTSPSVAGEIVFFTTSVEGGVPAASTAALQAAAEPRYNLYAITYYGTPGYANGTTTGGSGGGSGHGGGSSGGGSSSVFAPVKSGAGRATAPFVVDQHLYFATSTGSNANVEAFGDPNDFNNGVGQVGVRILSWREIRR